MACIAVIKKADGSGQPLGPFVTRVEAENCLSGAEGVVEFFEVDDFIAFGAEVN